MPATFSTCNVVAGAVNGQAGVNNAPTILGDAGSDTVNLIGGWTRDSGLSGGGFDVYAFNAAPDVKVAVQDTVTVNTP